MNNFADEIFWKRIFRFDFSILRKIAVKFDKRSIDKNVIIFTAEIFRFEKFFHDYDSSPLPQFKSLFSRKIAVVNNDVDAPFFPFLFPLDTSFSTRDRFLPFAPVPSIVKFFLHWPHAICLPTFLLMCVYIYIYMSVLCATQRKRIWKKKKKKLHRRKNFLEREKKFNLNDETIFF